MCFYMASMRVNEHLLSSELVLGMVPALNSWWLLLTIVMWRKEKDSQQSEQ